jgi:hypothetical protein
MLFTSDLIITFVIFWLPQIRKGARDRGHAAQPSFPVCYVTVQAASKATGKVTNK